MIWNKGPKARGMRRSTKHDPGAVPIRPVKFSTAPSGFMNDTTIPTAVGATDISPEIHQSIAPGQPFFGGLAGDGLLPSWTRMTDVNEGEDVE